MIYFICVILFVILLILAVRIHLLQKSIREISDSLTDILSIDTNSLISISSRNRYICRLAAQLNGQLSQLRREHLRYENGDRELKDAVTNISHDLRTPLTAINGYLELLQKESHSGETLRYLEIIRNRTESMKQLTEELFCYSVSLSAREDAPVSLSLNRMLEDSLISFWSAFELRGITPVISMPETAVQRTLDPSSLSRVFSNILSNALKYSDGDLRVTLTEKGSVTFSNRAAALTPVTTAKLFDRFYTIETVNINRSKDTRTADSSTGLGLSIAKLLTKRMGGDIAAEYKEGELHITVQL